MHRRRQPRRWGRSPAASAPGWPSRGTPSGWRGRATTWRCGCGAATDGHHVAVEFIHPVIVGKRALPAMALTNDVATLTGVARTQGFDEVYAAQLELLADSRDIALGISPDGQCRNVLRGLEVAHGRGLLTVALTGGDGGEIARSPAVDHALVAHSEEPQVVKEIHVTIYHILWELVHVFFEQPGLLDPEVVR
ncbi:D-sedoheptulose-7-phosphate isomerase [Carbonactinospora thermoautotrophica]|uniref:D-sedoheptulose-7-phosphate isomerase n=1 Tax=Carbonactinospora thermoautotrophica TaxID=1469144 RepID=UPI003DAA3D5E